MKRFFLYLSISVIIATAVGAAVAVNEKKVVRESLTYFPIDQTVAFTNKMTSLSLTDEKDDDEYVVRWMVESALDKPIYLRQDISLLFAEGRLKDILNEWEEDAKDLSQRKEVYAEDSNHFETISFHHGEVHYENDVIKSVQAMSYDHLYVIDSPMTPLESFRQPGNEEEVEWKKILDHATSQQLSYSWNKLLRHYEIPREKYVAIPLTELISYDEKPLPNITMKKTEQVIGNLWEGLYKNYILGLKQGEKGPILSPIGSSLPLVLFSKDGTHLLVLIEGKHGQYFQLVQYYS